MHASLPPRNTIPAQDDGCLVNRQQDAVVEQQGELIRFLQRRCDNLAREVLHLQAREDRYLR